MHPITLGWLHLVALLGAAQGCVLAVALATRRRNRTANRLLAAAMLAFSISLATAVYHGAGLESRFPHFFGLGYPLPLLFGPLIYLYVLTAGDHLRGLRPRDWLHFLPFAAAVAAALPVYLSSAPDKLAFFAALQRGEAPAWIAVADPLKFVSGLGYSVATLLALRRHRRRVKRSYSSLDRVNLRWLLWLGGASAAIWLVATVLELSALADHPAMARTDDLIALAVALLVYGIGYRALRQPEVFDYAAIDVPTGSHRVVSVPEITPAPPGPAEPPAAPVPAESPRPYERSGLSEREAEALAAGLVTAMEQDRAYRDSELTLADLADRLGTTPHKLSEVLNTRLEQTFYDFVNAHRVRDVQRRIADERFRNLTILALALDAGFASKSTFNHVFRQHTGQTPSDYRRSLVA